MRRLLLLLIAIVLGIQLQISESAFAKEVDDDQPMGAAGGTVHVDPFTGSATTSIPIQVFPGRNGVQPNLQLTYASASGNGWVGMGWKLELGAIERNTRFGVTFNETAADNGKVYAVRMSGVSAELLKLTPSNPADPEYRAKVESGFHRVRTLTTGGWEVTDRKGVKYLFGTSVNARVEDPNDPSRVFRWNLDRVEDRDGNYVVVTYTKDQGQSYLSQIDYTYTTKDATSAPYSIKFYSNTPVGMSAPDTYNAYFKVVTAKRLQAIEIKANGATMRAYKLSYTPSPTTGTYLLTQVQQFDRNAMIDPVTYSVTGSALPPMTMAYSTSSSTFTPSTTDWLTGWCSGGTEISSGELNADGQQDLWCKNPSGGISGARANSDATLTNTGTGATGCTTIGVADVNADGRGDAACYTLRPDPGYCNSLPPHARILCLSYQPQAPIISIASTDSNGVFGTSSTWLDGGTCVFSSGFTPLISVLDFNGDGRNDIWCANNFAISSPVLWFAHSNDNGTFSSAGSIANFCGTSNVAMGSGDFNGDGRSDIWCHTGTGTTSIAYSTSSGIAASFTAPITPLTGWCPTTVPPSLQRLDHELPGLAGVLGKGKLDVIDFNGDGLQDLWCHVADGTVKVALSTGASFSAPTVWRTGFCITGKTGAADFNGDGVTDAWCHATDGTTQVMLSTGSTFSSPTPWLSGFCTTETFGTADLNGDAKPDLWCVNSGNVSVALAGSPGIKTDLLTSVSNGIGSSTALTYAPSTALGVTHTLLPYPTYVAIGIAKTVSTSVAGVIGSQISQSSYHYQKGYHSLPDRDFRGFQRATVTACAACSASEKTITVTEFHQGAGTAPTEDIGATLSHPDAPTKGLPYRILVQDGAYTPLLETLTTYAVDVNGQAPWYTPPSQVLTKTYANGSVAKTTQANFTYDHTYGNVVQENHHGDLGVTGDEKTIERDFANETTIWLLGFPKRETIYKGISTAATDRMAETTFFYDGVANCATGSTVQVPTIGHLTRTVNWLNGGTSPETRMAYDLYGNRTCTWTASGIPAGSITTTTYDSTYHLFPVAVTNALTHQVTTWYYGVTVGTDPTKGLFGQVAMVIDPNGIGHTLQYDVLGRKTIETGGSVSPIITTYNNLGGGVGVQNLRVAAGLGNEALTTTTYFDGLGRGIKREQTGPSQPTPTTIITQTEYNITGTVKRAATPRFSTDATLLWTNPQYDALGRVVRVDLPSPAGQSIRSLSCYDDWVTVTIDANNHKKRETRDAYGRLIRVDEYTGTFTACDTAVGTPYATTTYQYDVLGNLVKLTDAKGNVTTMRYDSLGRKIAMSDPDMGRCGDLTALTPNATYPWYSAPCWNYQYDAAGNLIQQTDAKGQHLYFQYDALNRRTQKDLLTQKAPGSGDVRYLYDPSGYCASTGKGRLWQIVSANAWTNLCYDGVGRVVVSQNTVLDGSGSSNGGETSFSYDTLGRLARVTYPNNLEEEGIVWPSQVVYEYTGPLLKRVYEVSQAYGVGEVYAQYSNYNALGQPGTVAFGNGTNTTYTYQPQTSRMEAYRTALGGSTYLHELYTYDAQGNVTFVWDQQSGAERQFSYDALDRFSSSGYWDGPDGNSFDFTATYDQIGNLTDSTMTSAVTFTAPVTLGAYTYPPSGPTSVRPHAVSTTTKPNLTTTYLYDANGNLSQGAGRKIDYDLENHPTCVATTTGVCSAASTKTQFFYDGDGQRVGKKKGTAQTVFYVNQYFECVGQNGGSGATNCTKYIWANGRRIAMRNAPYATSPGQPQPATAVSYYHADHLGSTRLVTGPNGATEQAAVYWPWGNMQYSDGQGGVRYKFTGQELDETGLYDYHARLYDPVLGRFITADTLVPNPGNPQDLNRYTYARNNPLLYTDPSGHFGIIEGIIFGVVIGAVASGIQSDWDLGSMIQGGVIGGMSGGVGAGIGTSVFQATVGSLGQTWAGVAGGVVGGAAAGGTSGVLASAAGYKVNIGLAIASGAAAGGIAGGAGAWGAQHGYGELTAFAASPVAGAAAAAIRGSDPGVGAAIAAATAAFSFSIQSFMNNHNLAGRELTAEEMKAAWSVFGNRMDYASVKIFDSKYFWTQASHYAVTPDGNIYWPSDSCGNMVVCGDSNLFIHEMTHVMQYQQGISVLGQGFLLQAGHFGSLTVYDPYSFTYDPTRAFSSYNIEQQGSLAEGIYRGVYTNNID